MGAGPAGLSAALNLRQRGKTVLVVHSGETLLAKAEQVDNYLGMPGLSGKQMMERFTQHARDAGAVLRKGRAGNVMPFGGRFMVNLDGDILETGAVVLACGVSKAKPVPGEAELLGRGVSYCATCDGMLYRGRAVAVWGLSPEAPQEANFLHGIGCSVTYIAGRRPDTLEAGVAFRAGRVEAVEGGPPWSRALGGAALPGQAFLSCARPRRGRAGARPCAGKRLCKTGAAMRTNIPGLFAAGDMTGKPLQVANAVGDGLVARWPPWTIWTASAP
ncbi:MAG: NAD(P)/FAD-dependent oxidoreductase [Ruthenibacterium lactatiformans]